MTRVGIDFGPPFWLKGKRAKIRQTSGEKIPCEKNRQRQLTRRMSRGLKRHDGTRRWALRLHSLLERVSTNCAGRLALASFSLPLSRDVGQKVAVAPSDLVLILHKSNEPGDRVVTRFVRQR